jgi:hypothetical protein
MKPKTTTEQQDYAIILQAIVQFEFPTENVNKPIPTSLFCH